MIFITGDTHADVRRFNHNNFPEQSEMTKDDYVIVCGDFGLVFSQVESKGEQYWLDWLERKSFTTLFVDGNHENFDRLDNYPVEKWNGGLVNKIRPSVLHLKRGEVFNLQGKTFFTFGGASSHDVRDGILESNETKKIKKFRREHKVFRVNHVSWWKEELPSEIEMQHGLESLAKVGNSVDYVITHSPSAGMMEELGCTEHNVLTDYLETIRTTVEYEKWFFGHMHDNTQISEKEFLLFEQIIKVI